MWGLSLVASSGGHSSSRCAGLSLSRPLLLQSTGSRRTGSVVVAHGPSCSVACGIFPDQGSNLCPLHWQADSQPLCHQGSPQVLFRGNFSMCSCGLIVSVGGGEFRIFPYHHLELPPLMCVFFSKPLTINSLFPYFSPFFHTYFYWKQNRC